MDARSFGVAALLLVVLAVVQQTSALQCWKCSSDIERACSDRFNISDFYGGGRSGYNSGYNNYQDRQYQQQRQYDPNYNPNYPNNPNNPNYPNQGGFNQNYNPNYNPNRNTFPYLETCDDSNARLRRMRNVCIKQVLRSSTYQTVIRRCEMIPYESYAGTCPTQDVSARGLSMDFCEYCEYDGCNSATGLKTNAILAAAALSVVILMFCGV